MKNNIKLLLTLKWINAKNENPLYIFLLSEDDCVYKLVSFGVDYTIFTLNKITHDLGLKKGELNMEELTNIIKESKNVEEYICVSDLDYKNIIIKYIRKIKIENILR